MVGPLVAIGVLLVSFLLSAQSDQLAFWHSWCPAKYKAFIATLVVLAAALIGAATYAGLDAVNFPLEDGWQRGLAVGLLAAGVTRVDLGQAGAYDRAAHVKNLTALVMRRVTTSLDRNASDHVRNWAFARPSADLVLHAWSAGDSLMFAAREPELEAAVLLLRSADETDAAKGRGVLSAYVADAYVKRHISRP